MDAAEIINDAAVRVEERAAKGKPRPVRVVPELQTWQQLQKVQGGLTPGEVSRRLSEADLGRMYALVDLANALRQKDGHLQGTLEAREVAIQQLQWDLELPKKPTKAEKKAAEWVKEVLEDCLGTAIAHASSSPYFGYSVCETVWRKTNGKIVIDRFDALAPRRFEYKGNRLFWNDNLGQQGVDVLDEYPGQFVVCRPRVNGDVPCREGLMRVLVWAALFRNWTLTDWLRLGEIAWKPWRIGTYDKSKFASQEEIDGLVTVLDAMSTSGTAVIPDSLSVSVEWPKGQAGISSSHPEMFGVMGREMSKSVLGQTETTEASASSGYAQAKVQYEVKKEKRDADARFIARDITRHVINYLYAWNFGSRIRPARLRFITDEAAELQAFGTGVEKLKKAGLRIPAKWARDKAGIPEPAEGEELLGDGLEQAEGDEKKPSSPENEPEEENDEA